MWSLFSGRLLAALFAAALLSAGCAVVPPATSPSAKAATIAKYQRHLASIADISHFNLQGRIGVQHDGKGFSGSMRWQHLDSSETIALFSPLGGQVASIQTTKDGVTLKESDGKSHSAKDAETLTQQTLGWSLPLRGLPDWVLGRPLPGSNATFENAAWDNAGRLTKLKQDGWEIEYSDYRETAGYQLPGRINLRSPKLYLKLIVEQWEIPANAQAGQP